MNTFFVILCGIGINSPVLDYIGRNSGQYNYVRGKSGRVYIAGYGPYNAADCDTHITITVEQLAEYAELLPSIDKSIAVTGIDDPTAFMAAFGLVRCNEDGSELVSE